MTEARLTPDAGPTMSNMTTSRTSSVSVARSVASSGAQEAAQTMLGLGVSRSQLQCPYVTSGPQQVLVLHIGQVSKKLRERAATGEDLCRFKYWSIEQNSIVKDVYLFPIGYTAIVVYQRLETKGFKSIYLGARAPVQGRKELEYSFQKRRARRSVRP